MKIYKIILVATATLISVSCARAGAREPLPGGKEWAVVNTSSAYLRAEARYSSECVSQTRMGTLVQVLDRKAYWVRVRTPEPYEGWVNELALAPTRALSAAEQEKLREWSPKLQTLSREQAVEYLQKPKYICIAEYTHIYAEPDSGAARVSDLLMSDILLKGGPAPMSSPEADFKTAAAPDSGTAPGAASRPASEGVPISDTAPNPSPEAALRPAGPNPGEDRWIPVETPQGAAGWVKENEVAPFAEWAFDRMGEIHGLSKMSGGKLPDELIAGRIIDRARLFLGSPYFWGGMSVKGFDCSGLAGLCYFMQGILLPRDAKDQALCGEEIPFGEMQPGDLIFFGDSSVGHVGIYIGDSRLIHSSQTVRINSLDPAQTDYYGRNILHIRRILGHVDDGTGPVSLKTSPLYFAQ